MTSTSGYLQYRFGAPGRIELAHPAVLEGSQQKFELESHRPYQGESELLNFSTPDYEYSVYQAAGTDPAPFKSAGVTVSPITADTPKYIEFKCSARRIEGLAGLTGIVRNPE